MNLTVTEEFRNQYIPEKLLFKLSQMFERVVCFPSSHSEGVCDGIGGAAKARVAEHVRVKRCDEVSVQTSEDFYEIAKKYCTKVTMLK